SISSSSSTYAACCRSTRRRSFARALPAATDAEAVSWGNVIHMREIEAQSVQGSASLDSAEGALPWQDLVASIFRHRRLVLITFFLGLIGVTAWAWTLPPSYKATAILMIRDNRTSLAVSPDERTGPLMDRGGQDDINSLVALLTSPALVEEILAKDDPKGAA